ncbi:hypothetical protein D9611_009243 [Ephemerocybe angulata]|uniref:WD repeat-containing protein JIP5 n=1 Tax=Ephemerocybe angulata TaxID=980116 RepID=A0A8H5F489_9AGAR|nr:hypothetical protein D9611_009243 [Tulosesus angulatus]
MPWMVATGDDDGTVKLWDPRQRDVAKTYTQHFDFISDFLWLPDKKQLVATSGDGTLSVMDIRSKKPEPIAHSEDQEDELLSIVAIKGSSKILVGTQIGVISIFNRNKGWADCVDRIPGHPLSVDALCNVPMGVPGVDADSTVLTGSSDGFVRAVQILPTKLVGVVADHGEFPVERIAVGEGVGQAEDTESEATPHDTRIKPSVDDDLDAKMEDDFSREKKWWVGSVGHDESLRMTDLEGFFRETAAGSNGTLDARSDDEDSDVGEGLSGEEGADGPSVGVGEDGDESSDESEDDEAMEEDEAEWESEDEKPKAQKRKRAEKDSIGNSKRGKKEEVVDKGFFDEL